MSKTFLTMLCALACAGVSAQATSGASSNAQPNFPKALSAADLNGDGTKETILEPNTCVIWAAPSFVIASAAPSEVAGPDGVATARLQQMKIDGLDGWRLPTPAEAKTFFAGVKAGQLKAAGFDEPKFGSYLTSEFSPKTKTVTVFDVKKAAAAPSKAAKLAVWPVHSASCAPATPAP